MESNKETHSDEVTLLTPKHYYIFYLFCQTLYNTQEKHEQVNQFDTVYLQNTVQD